MKVLMISTLTVSLLILSGMIFMYKSQPKSAYVRLGYIYDNFGFKKELETKLNNVVQVRKTILDSLSLELNMLSRKIQEEHEKDQIKIDRFNDEKQKYLSKKQQFDEDNQSLKEQYTQEIMKQLNQYVQDYANDKGLAFVYGAEGTGAIMAADQKYDMTTPILAYINERYQGKK
jgi:outer membrane protein